MKLSIRANYELALIGARYDEFLVISLPIFVQSGMRSPGTGRLKPAIIFSSRSFLMRERQITTKRRQRF
jgi:hypothetical protein